MSGSSTLLPNRMMRPEIDRMTKLPAVAQCTERSHAEKRFILRPVGGACSSIVPLRQ